MATDYEKFYRDNPNGLGDPTQVFVDFFENYERLPARVLDVGCGQGRDALFIARKGHRVHGVDISPTGIADLLEAAHKERLKVSADVGDVRTYVWNGPYDVIVIDRTLHMLKSKDRCLVLQNILQAAVAGTHILIADEKSNIGGFKTVFDEDRYAWTYTLKNRGYLFAFAV